MTQTEQKLSILSTIDHQLTPEEGTVLRPNRAFLNRILVPISVLVLSQLACGKTELYISIGGVVLITTVFYATMLNMDKKIDDSGYMPLESPDSIEGKKRYRRAKWNSENTQSHILENTFRELVTPNSFIPTLEHELNKAKIKPEDLAAFADTDEGKILLFEVREKYELLCNSALVNEDPKLTPKRYLEFTKSLAEVIKASKTKKR
jgi:hypothetical protein